MHDLPFDKPGRFYKGNIHTHSNRSDGTLAPQEVVELYRARGYDFLAVTDHFWSLFDFPITDTRAFRTEDFTTLIGAEMHCAGPPVSGEWPNGLWHLIGLGLPLDFAPTRPDETVQELTSRAAASGAWISLAHPASQGLETSDVLDLEHLDAIEIYNAGSEFYDERADGWYLADSLAARGRRIGVCAVDDAHFDLRPNNFLAFMCVKAEANTPEALLSALKARHYYTSQGPEIHDIDISDTTITIRCSPVESIAVAGRGLPPQNYYGPLTTEHTFTRGNGSGFLRVTIRDGQKRRAWSNPIFLNGE